MNHAQIRSICDGVSDVVLPVAFGGGARRATKYVSPTFTIKATRRFRPRKNDRMTELLLAYGKPNFAERAFIKACIKAGEPFPVKRVQVAFWPKRRS